MRLAVSPTGRRRSRFAALVTVLALGVPLAACGHQAAQSRHAGSPAAHGAVQAAGTAAGATVPASTVVATLHANTPSFAAPGGPQTGTVPGSWYGSPSALPVLATRPGWLQVRLAQRPNDSTAWILANQASLARSPDAIVVDLSTLHLTLYRNAKRVFSAPVGIGTPTDPTPTGQYFVALYASPPSPAYGAFVMATSAHSDTITDWSNSGDAIVAIHGPLGSDSQIGTTGAAISHGCIRLHERDLIRLRQVPAGSPIDIVA